jgi:hypothetical protein
MCPSEKEESCDSYNIHTTILYSHILEKEKWKHGMLEVNHMIPKSSKSDPQPLQFSMKSWDRNKIMSLSDVTDVVSKELAKTTKFFTLGPVLPPTHSF